MKLAGTAPEVTVVIATRDRRDWLERTLASVRAQRRVAVQVVVVDDGSADGTPELLEREARRGLIWARHSSPRGVAAARNAGIERADAPWVAMIDDDDLWSPSKLRDQLDAASRENRQWVYSSVLVVDQELEPLAATDAPDPETLLARLLQVNVLAGGASSVCARTALLEEAGGFDERFSHLADWDLWIRLASAGPAARCQQLHTAYVLHPGNMVLAAPAEPRQELLRLTDKHQALCAQHGVVPSRARLAQWVAWRHRLAGRRLAAAALYARSAVQDRDPTNLIRSALTLADRTGELGRRPSPPPVAPSWLTIARSRS